MDRGAGRIHLFFLTLAGQHLNRLSDTVYQVRLTGQLLTNKWPSGPSPHKRPVGLARLTHTRPARDRPPPYLLPSTRPTSGPTTPLQPRRGRQGHGQGSLSRLRTDFLALPSQFNKQIDNFIKAD